MDLKTTTVMAVFAFFLSSSITLISYLIYLNLPEKQTETTLNLELHEKANALIGIKNQISQFYQNMRFNHNKISYEISPDCNPNRIQRMETALSIINQKTEIISFTKKESNSDIQINCFSDRKTNETEFIVGEGGPTEIFDSPAYPIIQKGEIRLYESSYCYDYPVVEMHELLHVFGFDHINQSSDIMYPYKDCNHRLSSNYTNILKTIYSVNPLSDLYFDLIDITKNSKYINFEISIRNKGLIASKNVTLKIYASLEEIGSFDIGQIDFSSAKKIKVNNLALPSEEVSAIKAVIYSPEMEMDKNNNILITNIYRKAS